MNSNPITNNPILINMKTYKLLLLSLPLFVTGCNKPVEDGDLSAGAWKLQLISVGNTCFDIPSDNISDKTSYILNFNSDTTFSFSTSVNQAGGTCLIFFQEKRIEINGYQEWTEVGQGNPEQLEFDEKLLSEFQGLMSYICTKNKLTITRDKRKFLFEKR